MDGESVGSFKMKPVPLPRKSNRNFDCSRESQSPRRSLVDSSSDINSNIDNLLEQKPVAMSKFSQGNESPPPANKPVPLPRKSVRGSNGTSGSTSSCSPSPSSLVSNMPDLTNFSAPQSIAGSVKSEDYEDDVDDDIDFQSIPSRPHLKEGDSKRSTINLFKRVVGDPFEDFESSIKEQEPLSTISFRSPIEDLDEAARSRISIASLSSSTTTTSKSSSDYSDLYMDPPPARPLGEGSGQRWRQTGTVPHSAFSSNTVPSKPKRSPHIIFPRLSSLDEGEVMPPTPPRVTSTRDSYEPLSRFSTAAPAMDTKFHTISSSSTKNVKRSNSDSSSSNNLSSTSTENSFSSEFKRATVPNIQHVVTQAGSRNQSESKGAGLGFFDATKFDISDVHRCEPGEGRGSPPAKSVVKRRSLGTPPKTGSPERPSSGTGTVILRRHSSGRSSVGSGVSRRDSNRSRKTHEYDEVTIEDGTVVIVSPAESSATLNNNSNSSLTSRNSLVQEFDPLFGTRQAGLLASGVLDLNDTEQMHRYEFIDEDNLSCDGSSTTNEDNGQVPMCIDNPSYSPTTPRASRVMDDVYEPVASPSPKLSPKPRMGTRILRGKIDSGSLSPPVVPEDKVDTVDTSSSAAGSTSQTNTSPPSQPQSNFFRKFSNRIRGLNPIREEKDDRTKSELLAPEETYASLTTACQKCSEPHPETTKCKFSPVYRHGVVFSSELYRTGGLYTKKEFSKKFCALQAGKLTFYNDKKEVSSEISLEKFVVVSKRNDYKVAQSQNELKCFEVGLSSAKNSSYVFAAQSEERRGEWMQKLIEIYTSAFPPSVMKNFDRGGWCFVKEKVTSDWRPCWLLLKDRTLYYSYWKGEEPFEIDLRKARSVVLSQKEEEYKCPYLDNGDMLTVDVITKLLFIQTDSAKVTASWEKVIKSAASFNGPNFLEMQLTQDNVPVIVDKCIDFLYAHGTLSEGIYRQSGSNTRITQLLQDFKNDAWTVQISHKEFSAHDVAGTLKRFFRTLPEPLVTVKLYDEWIKAPKIGSMEGKMEEYMRLLELLPEINYNIMKKLIRHLYTVHELHEKNLMPLINLAPIWGPTLMNVDSSTLAQSYEIACAECEVIKDLIENYYSLFRVDQVEIEKEKKMQDALENFHLGSCKRKCSGDMKIWIYVWEKDETSPINITLTPNSTTRQIVHQICSLQKIDNLESLTLHEVICNESLERPLHPSEKVIETVLRWSIWDSDERKTNYLILKKNTLYPSLVHYAKEPKSITGELKYADSKSKSFRKFTFQFSQETLKYFKDGKSTSELGSWKIDDMVWYLGCESKRNAPTRWTFTFVKRNYPFKRSKEEPFFGNSILCASEDELHKWIGAMVIGEHPEGLSPIIV